MYEDIVLDEGAFVNIPEPAEFTKKTFEVAIKRLEELPMSCFVPDYEWFWKDSQGRVYASGDYHQLKKFAKEKDNEKSTETE